MTVLISGVVHKALSDKVREWSGLRDATLTFSHDRKNSAASFNRDTHVITADAEALVLNPNRVVRTMTPFRLRQEAVLTGALLHECAHARFSRWSRDDLPKGVVSLAVLLEEARCEARMAACIENGEVPAHDLAWTMQAMAAKVLPRTVLSSDSDQAVLDVIGSWALRAGRRYGAFTLGDDLPPWASDFTRLLHGVLVDHFMGTGSSQAAASALANMVIMTLVNMTQAGPSADTGTEMTDRAAEVLALLFPDNEDPPSPSPGNSGCDHAEPSQGESEGEGQPGEGEGQPGEDEGEGQPGEDESSQNPALSKMEATVEVEMTEETDEIKASVPKPGGKEGGRGSGRGADGFRDPTPAERDVQTNAARFLREVIAPSETSHVVLSETPSALVDGAALSAWKAGGQQRAPRFFERTRRDSSPSSPVKVAILVDVSSSMEALQKPSALLSWALSSAALDLRNFAGRGTQVESCLIHWGTEARVVAANGALIPGIREVPCDEGTAAMGQALALVEEQIPGFFDVSATHENRLLVQFTDWELWDFGDSTMLDLLSRGFEAGVNMLSVVPSSFSDRYLQDIMARTSRLMRDMVGGSTMLAYKPKSPEQVWEEAANLLA